MKQRIGKILTAALLALTIGNFAAIATGEVPKAANVIVNGEFLSIEKYNPIWNDAKTRILVKPEFFADYLDAEVSAEENVITISKNGHFISFTESETRFVMDGIGGRNLESANIIYNGEFYIPLRFMSEALGVIVGWEDNTAVISTDDADIPEKVAQYLKDVTLFDQSTIRIEGEKIVYIDPYRIAGEPNDGEIILITHTHPDHFDIDSIKKVMKESAEILIAGEGGVERAKENGLTNVQSAVPNSEYTVDGIAVKTIPAYNTGAERRNHLPEHNYVGYIVEVNGVTYYSAGDTDYIEDMNGLDVDVAFLPIDGRFNMEETEAARAANAIAPKVAVPYHFNNFASEEKARDFIALLDKEITGVIMTFKMYDNK